MGARHLVRRNDAGFSEPVVGAAVARPGYGGIVLGPQASLGFDPQPVSRRRPQPGHAWPLGDELAHIRRGQPATVVADV
jgi:hypothetical protein